MKKDSLHNIKNTGFKAPKNYFSNLEETLLNEVKLKDKITTSGFKIPDGYLSSFIINSPKDINPKTKVFTLFNRKTILYASSIAATIVLLFNLGIFNNTTENFDINSLATETIDEYILEEINIKDLASLFTDNELTENQFIDYNLEEDTLDSYLESENLNELLIE